MKNAIKCMCMLALVAIAFASCTKTEEKQKGTFKATIRDAEYEVVGGERAYVAPDNKIQFETGDVCMVCNVSTEFPHLSHCATYEALDEGNTVAFKNCGLGEVAENALDKGYYAFYPNSMLETHFIDGENRVTFTLSSTQTYRENMVGRGDLPMAAYVDNVSHLTDAFFTFQSLCGVLQLQPYEVYQRTVTGIEIVDNAFNLNGSATMDISQFGSSKTVSMFDHYDPSNADAIDELAAYLTNVGFDFGASKESTHVIHLDCPGGVQLGDTKDTTPKFNIVLRPLALSQGCHIIFNFSDGSVKDVDLSAVNLMIKPNFVKNVGLNLDAY